MREGDGPAKGGADQRISTPQTQVQDPKVPRGGGNGRVGEDGGGGGGGGGVPAERVVGGEKGGGRGNGAGAGEGGKAFEGGVDYGAGKGELVQSGAYVEKAVENRVGASATNGEEGLVGGGGGEHVENKIGKGGGTGGETLQNRLGGQIGGGEAEGEGEIEEGEGENNIQNRILAEGEGVGGESDTQKVEGKQGGEGEVGMRNRGGKGEGAYEEQHMATGELAKHEVLNSSDDSCCNGWRSTNQSSLPPGQKKNIVEETVGFFKKNCLKRTVWKIILHTFVNFYILWTL